VKKKVNKGGRREGKKITRFLYFSYLLPYLIFEEKERETGIVLTIRTLSETHSPKVRR
jgi:hypothetical protein